MFQSKPDRSITPVTGSGAILFWHSHPPSFNQIPQKNLIGGPLDQLTGRSKKRKKAEKKKGRNCLFKAIKY